MIAVRSVFSVLIICLLLSPLAAESLARPTVFPGSMASSQPLSVQMSSSDADASLRYTLDGSTPDESSALVPAGGQLTISSDSYLRVRAFRTGDTPSRIAGGNYRIGGLINQRRTHVLFTKSDGSLLAWGENDYGECGNGFTSAYQPRPYPVSLSTTVRQAFAAPYFSLAVDNDGQVYSWGRNIQNCLAQSGDTATPLPITGLSDCSQVAISYYHGFALSNGGQLYSWGQSSETLGRGPSPSTAPATINLANVISIGMGNNCAFAIDANGDLWAWGYNQYGRLGLGHLEYRDLPERNAVLSDVIEVSGGDVYGQHSSYGFSLALDAEGRVWGWGQASGRVLGIDNNSAHAAPIQVPLPGPAVDIEVGTDYAFALLADGRVVGWGSNADKELLLPDGNSYLPTEVPALAGKRFWAGANTLIEGDDQWLYGIGDNDQGQLALGHAEAVDSLIQSEVFLAAQAARPRLSVGSCQSTQALSVQVSCETTGASIHYRLDGLAPSEGDPQIASGESLDIASSSLLRVRAFAGGLAASNVVGANYRIGMVMDGDYEHQLMAAEDGELFTWGDGRGGQLGVGGELGYQSHVKAALSNELFMQVAGGYRMSFAVTTEGRLFSWGENSSSNELQQSDDVHVPTEVTGLTNMRQVDANGNAVFALDTTGTLLTWGNTSSGQLGRSGDAKAPGPVPLPTVTSFISIASSIYAIDEESRLWFWGYGGNGQSGDGLSLSSTVPQPVAAIDGLVEVAGGQGRGSHYQFCCALDVKGRVWGWGANYGSLGRDDDWRFTMPIQIPLPGPAVDIEVGEDFGFARLADGRVFGWGNNEEGQLLLPASDWEAPTEITALAGQVFWAGRSTMVLKSDQWLYGVGENDRAELAIGTAGDQTTLTRSNYFAGDRVEAPRLELGSSNLAQGREIRVDCDTPAARIHYRFDGEHPDSGDPSIAPGESLQIDSTCQLRLRAYGAGLEPSRVVGANYRIGHHLANRGEHVLLVEPNGELVSWGRGENGELGIGLTQDYAAAPQRLSGLPPFLQVDCDTRFSLAVAADGQAYSWGSNNSSRTLQPTELLEPTPIAGLNDMLQMKASYSNGIGLQEGGLVYTWGSTSSGALGRSGSGSQPGQVDLPPITAIEFGASAGYAIDEEGELWVWGSGNNGQLATGVSASPSEPLRCGALTSMVEVHARLESGNYHTYGFGYGLDVEGRVWAWGYNYGYPFGRNDLHYTYDPIQIPLPAAAVDIEVSEDGAFAVLSDGRVFGWGNNSQGQLLLPVSPWEPPTEIPALQGRDFWAGRTTLVRGDDDWLYSVGDNKLGQCCQGLNVDPAVYGRGLYYFGTLSIDPDQSLAQHVSLKGGSYPRAQELTHNFEQAGLVLRYTTDGSLPDGTSPVWASNEVLNVADTMVLQLAAFDDDKMVSQPWSAQYVIGSAYQGNSKSSSCVRPDGRVWAWGENSRGQLGDGHAVDRWFPMPSELQVEAQRVATNSYGSIALDTSGQLWSWGTNSYKQLGPEDTSGQPQRIDGIDAVRDIALSVYFAAACRGDGSVWWWGKGIDGDSGQPTQLIGMEGIVRVYAKGQLLVALDEHQNMWLASPLSYTTAFGYNVKEDPILVRQTQGLVDIGLEGGETDRSPAISLLFQDGSVGFANGSSFIKAGVEDVIDVAGGRTHSLVLDRERAVWAWGTTPTHAFTDAFGNSVAPNDPALIRQDPALTWVGAGEASYCGGLDDFWAVGPSEIGQTGVGVAINFPSWQPGDWFDPDFRAPRLSLPGGRYVSPVTVTLTAERSSADIHYTLDGSEPTKGSKRLRNGGSLVIGTTSVLRARAWTPEGESSGTRSAAFTIGPHAAAGAGHSIFINGQGQVFTIGQDGDGQLGDGVAGPSGYAMHPLTFSRPIRSVHATPWASFAVDIDGAAWAWGRGDEANQGLGSRDDQVVPQMNPSMRGVFAIGGGPTVGYAMTSSGANFAWGTGMEQLGLEDRGISSAETPRRMDGLPRFIKVLGNATNTFALDENGFVWSWGSNDVLAGYGGADSNGVPLRLGLVRDVIDIAVGDDAVFALLASGRLVMWGEDRYFQDTEAQVERFTTDYPWPLEPFARGISIAAGDDHMIMLDESGQVWGLGNSIYGGLGHAWHDVDSEPVVIWDSSPVQAISACTTQSIVVSNGVMWETGRYDSVNSSLAKEHAPVGAGVPYWRLPRFAPIEDISGPGPDTTVDAEGCDFYTAFLPTDGFYRFKSILRISAREETTVVVESPQDGRRDVFVVPAGDFIDHLSSIDRTLEPGRSMASIRIYSDKPISVVAHYIQWLTGDSVRVFPANVLGSRYCLSTWNGIYVPPQHLAYPQHLRTSPHVAVIALQDDTVIDIAEPSDLTGSSWNELPDYYEGYYRHWQVTLDAGEVYFFDSAWPRNAEPETVITKNMVLDLTGTTVTANGPVAVLRGNRLGAMPDSNLNQLVEQSIPTNNLGRRFLVVPYAGIDKSWAHITTDRVDAKVWINGEGPLSVSAFMGLRLSYTDAFLVESDQPLVVSQFSSNNNLSDEIGDPNMIDVPATSQFLRSYQVHILEEQFETGHLTVFGEPSALSNIRINGQPVLTDVQQFHEGWAYAHIDLTPGLYDVEGDMPFGLLVYGFDYHDAFGYFGGQNFVRFDDIASMSVLPDVMTSIVGREIEMLVRVYDDAGRPVAGTPVHIAGSSTHTIDDLVYANADGQARWRFTGSQAGIDNLTITAGEVTRPAKIEWLVPGEAGQLPVVVIKGGTFGTDPGLPTRQLSAEDLDDGSHHPLGFDFTLTVQPDEALSIGTHLVQVVAVDSAGRADNQTVQVLIEDQEAPIIVPDNGRKVGTDTSLATLDAANIPLPQVSDNHGLAAVTHDLSGSLALGTHTVTWTARDLSGNETMLAETIQVTDLEPPVIELPVVMVVDADQAIAFADLSPTPPVVYDNVGVESLLPSGQATLPLGRNEILWTATDAAGNQSTAKQTVFVGVTDAGQPTLRLLTPEDQTVFEFKYRKPLAFVAEVSDLDLNGSLSVHFILSRTDKFTRILELIDNEAPFVQSYAFDQPFFNTNGTYYLRTVVYLDGKPTDIELPVQTFEMR